MAKQDPGGADRDAIFARRAILLSTALATLHCSANSETGREPTGTASGAATSPADSGSATTTPSGKAPAPLPGWDDVMAKAPPRGAPSVLGEAEKTQLGYLEQGLTTEYDSIKAVWQGLPDCDGAAPDCRPAWRALGERAKAMYDATRGPRVPGCGGAPGTTGTVMGRATAHKAYVAELIRRLEEHIGALAASFSTPGEQQWLKLLANAKKPPPMPCLSPCAMPEIAEILHNVPFAANSSALNAVDATTKAALESIVASYKANRKPSKVIVRGHADAKETGPAELAAARAKAVADWLVKAGIPKAEVEAKSYGKDVPIGRSDEEGSAAQNRRVDFEAAAK